MPSSVKQHPSRQHTLREAIAWSHDLLTPEQQAFFRRLGVFSGGADLDAINAVTADATGEADRLDMVFDLVDTSLATVTEDFRGEPRVGMLETIRTFALGQLRAAGELDEFRRAHAQHYVGVVQRLRTQLVAGIGAQVLEARRDFEVEHDNVREALSWALDPDKSASPPSDRVEIALRLSAEAGRLWYQGGYGDEARQWLERVIGLAGELDTHEVARCMFALTALLLDRGDLERTYQIATRAVSVCRRLGDEQRLANGLGWLGYSAQQLGHRQAGRDAFEESVVLARQIDARADLSSALSDLALLESSERNFDRSLQFAQEALDISHELGDEYGALLDQHNIATILRAMGRPHEALALTKELVPQMLRLAEPRQLVMVAEGYAALQAELGHHESACRLLGSAEAARSRSGTPREPTQQLQIEGPLATARAALGSAMWDREHHRGCAMSVEEALTEAQAVSTEPS